MDNEVSRFQQSQNQWRPSENYRPPQKATETMPVLIATEADVKKMPTSSIEWYSSVQSSQALTAEEYAARGVLIDYVPAPGQESCILPLQQVEDATPTKGRFGEGDFSTFVIDDNKGKVILTNFKLEITGLFHLILLKGTSQDIIGLRLCSRKHRKDLKVSLSDYHRLEKVLKKEHPEFHVYAANVKGEPLFQDYLARCYEDALSNMMWRNLYQEAGWYEVQPGEWRYLSALDDCCLGTKSLPDVKRLDMAPFCQHAFGILQIANLDIMLPLFLGAHIDALLCPFELSGHSVQHLLVIVGPTNSKKTSVAKALYCHFNMMDTINFTATDAGMERTLEQAHDGTLVLDDMASAKDRDIKDKINFVLRQIGDSTGRVKTANTGTETERADTRCFVVVTAESEPDRLQQSGKLRLLVVSVTQTSFNEEMLRAYQQDVVQSRLRHEFSRWEVYKAGFIRFVERNFTNIVSMMATCEPDHRFRFPRQTESYMQYTILAKLVMRFHCESGFLSEDFAEKILQEQWLPCIWRWVKANEARCAEDDPVLLFLTALTQGIVTNQLIIASDRKSFVVGRGTAAGFWDGSFLAILPDVGYEYATAYYAKLGRALTATEKDIVAFLYDRGISEGYEQKGRKGKPLKNIKIDGLSLPILYLSREKVKNLLAAQQEMVYEE